jgi:16S rRNA (guanine527-N7)-methyltransferase
MNPLAERLARGMAELGLNAPQDVQRKLLDYVALLGKWNKVYNLTAITDPEEMVSYHLLDSLAVLPHLWPGRWLDVGCGAGLPGLVLALMRPDWEFTLLDSNSKKTGFVQQAIIELQIKNARVVCARVEEFKAENDFDGIISRAFAEVNDFLALTRGLLAQNGKWAAMKGEPAQELKQLPPGVKVEKIVPLTVPGVIGVRSLVILCGDN